MKEMKPHKHAHLIKQYANDAMQTEEPWLRWQSRAKGDPWFPCNYPVGFFKDVDYRRVVAERGLESEVNSELIRALDNSRIAMEAVVVYLDREKDLLEKRLRNATQKNHD